jgi:hypothetical protein
MHANMSIIIILLEIINIIYVVHLFMYATSSYAYSRVLLIRVVEY